jgi:hypothetical protein
MSYEIYDSELIWQYHVTITHDLSGVPIPPKVNDLHTTIISPMPIKYEITNMLKKTLGPLQLVYEDEELKRDNVIEQNKGYMLDYVSRKQKVKLPSRLLYDPDRKRFQNVDELNKTMLKSVVHQKTGIKDLGNYVYDMHKGGGKTFFEKRNAHERAIFIAQNMNELLDDYSTLYLNTNERFLSIDNFVGDDGLPNQFEEYPGDGIVVFYGPQPQMIVDFVVHLVTEHGYETENEEDFDEKMAEYVDELYQKKIKRGRIEGQMALQRVSNNILNADIRKKIGRMTSQFGGTKKRKRKLPPKYD